MTETATTTALTANHIRDMVRGPRGQNLDPCLRQQPAVLDLAIHYLLLPRDAEGHQAVPLRHGSRGQPQLSAYWCDWMADGSLNKDSDSPTIHAVILHGSASPACPVWSSPRQRGDLPHHRRRCRAVLRFVQRPL